MKKFFIYLFIIFNFNSFAFGKTTTFTNEIFQKAQSDEFQTLRCGLPAPSCNQLCGNAEA